MKKILIGLILLAVTGCTQGPDFTNEAVVQSKVSTYSTTSYVLNRTNEGVRGQGWGRVQFNAPSGFAQVGDTITFKEGCLIATKGKQL